MEYPKKSRFSFLTESVFSPFRKFTAVFFVCGFHCRKTQDELILQLLIAATKYSFSRTRKIVSMHQKIHFNCTKIE